MDYPHNSPSVDPVLGGNVDGVDYPQFVPDLSTAISGLSTVTVTSPTCGVKSNKSSSLLILSPLNTVIYKLSTFLSLLYYHYLFYISIRVIRTTVQS